MGTIFKVSIEFVTILLLFFVFVLAMRHCRILAPQPGVELTLPTLEDEVLITGPPRKSQGQQLIIKYLLFFIFL